MAAPIGGWTDGWVEAGSPLLQNASSPELNPCGDRVGDHGAWARTDLYTSPECLRGTWRL